MVKYFFLIFYFVLSTITKYDIEIIILFYTSLSNIILFSFFLSYIFYFNYLFLFYLEIVTKRYLKNATEGVAYKTIII